MDILKIIFIFEIVGTISFSISGAIAGINKKADVFGVVFLSVMTALGGGVIRDIIIGNIPPKAFLYPVYFFCGISVSLLVFLFAYFLEEKYHNVSKYIDKINNIFDAIGLGVFTIIGMNAGINAGFSNHPYLLIFLGMATGIGGGIIRDTLVNEIPFVLHKKVYAIASMIGAVTYYFLNLSNINHIYSIFISISLVFLIRMISTKFDFNLPVADINKSDDNNLS